ncbi:MAG: substrate-binding domain-containing protein [Verrucomicrobia bacterium]|nr:substrate-binding domain-containing protein [Verrucomicrobiota bacterium]
MSSSPRRFALPQRISLSVQAAAAIREAIKEGAWKEFLPSERRLCEIFQVSRPTIRNALHKLASDGWLDIQQGRRNRILSGLPPTAARKSRLIGLVTHEPVSHLPRIPYQGISEMRAHLAGHGFATEILVCQPGTAGAQRRKLETFVRQNRVFCCVLLSVSQELQQWFAGHSVPALVLGSCHPTVKLPSLDVDYRSVCRHAAGIFLGKGHTRLAFVVPSSGLAGDLAGEQGFQEGVEQRIGNADARAIIVRHDGTAQNITAKLDALFNSSHAPTALLVAKPEHVFAVVIYLLKRGLSVPDTVSLIARDQDYLFETVNPPVSHYQFEEEEFAHRLSRLMLKLVSQGSLSLEPNLIFPKFFAGGTVKRCAG